MPLLALVLLAACFLAAQCYRDRLAAAERLEAGRERAELLNRLQGQTPFVPPIVTPIVKLPKPGDDDAEPDGFNLIGTDVTRLAAA